MDVERTRTVLAAELRAAEARQDGIAADSLLREPSEELGQAVADVATLKARLRAVDLAERRFIEARLADEKAERLRDRRVDAAAMRRALDERLEAAEELDRLLPLFGALVTRFLDRGEVIQRLFATWNQGFPRSQETAQHLRTALGETPVENAIEYRALKAAGLNARSTDMLSGTLAEFVAGRNEQVVQRVASIMPEVEEPGR